MSFLKQSAFSLGLIAGLATIGAAGAVLLTYLFTGKLPAVKMAGGDKPRVQLFTPDELVTLMRQQMGGTQAGEPSTDIGE
ncbi:MAG: hypothetical protein JXM73_09500 [Anaerolineae bacterium]|nr:hypothetical protein [Anaerolineae bacterium]